MKLILFTLLMIYSIQTYEIYPIKSDIAVKQQTKSINVFVTVYKYDKNSQPTADGSIIKKGVFWCAVSPNLMKDHKLDFGDTIFYKNVGYAIHDLTHYRLKNRVDLLIHDNQIFSEHNNIYINID